MVAAATPAGLGRRLSLGDQARLAMRVSTTDSLAELVLARTGGHLRATHVLSFIAAYGVFVEQTGREPGSVLEMAATVKSERSRQTLDRWARQFRQAFPEYDMPAVLWASIRDQVVKDTPPTSAEALSLQIGAALV